MGHASASLKHKYRRSLGSGRIHGIQSESLLPLNQNVSKHMDKKSASTLELSSWSTLGNANKKVNKAFTLKKSI